MVPQILQSAWDFYQYALDKSDPRSRHWFLLSGLGPVSAILAAYLVAVLVGPVLMKNRPPLKLTTLIVVYNFVLVILSAYVTLEVVRVVWLRRYSFLCEEVDWSDAPLALDSCCIGWWFFFLKVIELADTLFFVVRKKNDQITFLHVYHHATMVLIGWLSAKYVPGGQAFLYPLVNSLVHVVMYTYYGMAAMGPSVRKYLWWKRYLTMFQLTQFVVMLTHTGVNAFITCSFPKLFNYCVFAYASTIMLLFLNFYHKAYTQGRRPPPSALHAKGEHSIQNGVTNHVANGVKKHS